MDFWNFCEMGLTKAPQRREFFLGGGQGRLVYGAFEKGPPASEYL